MGRKMLFEMAVYDLIYYKSSRCMMTPIKFLLKRICGLEEAVWKIPWRLFSACQSFVSERNERSIFGLTHPIKFLLMRTYGLEVDAVWRISRLLFSSWSTWYLIKMSLFWASMLPGFCSREHMVFKQKLFKEFQDGCFMHGHLWNLNGLIWAIIQCLLFALVYAQIDICFGKNILFDELKTAAIVTQHNEPACSESTIPSLMSYKLSHCLL